MNRFNSLRALALIAALGAVGCDGDPVTEPDDGGLPLDGDMTDPCEGITECSTAGTSCTGDTLVTCAADTAGCLVETETDCGSMGQTCDASGATAMCADEDPCEAIPAAERCDTEGRSCDGDSLEICAANADGCLVVEVTDCAASEGGACDASGEMPMCALPADPCDGVADACAAEGTSCDGDSLVECAPNAFGCLVETRSDCSARADGTCDDSGSAAECTFTGDPCDGVTQCAAEGQSCDGPSLVVCEADAYGCLVETRTDCAETMFGFCDADATPAPVCSTAATDPCMGVTECSAAGSTCSGDSVVDCAPNAFGCLVEETTDCAAGGEVCGMLGSMAVCGDVCDFRATCPQATYCAGADAVACSIDADGCLVEDSRTTCDGPCDAGECFGACSVAAPTIIDCASGTVSGDTAMGGAAITAYDPCTTSTNYAGNEQVFVFRNADRAAVDIASTRTGTSGDFDLFVLDGGDGTAACDSGVSCLDSSRRTGGDEDVTFVAEAGQLYYVVYDIFSSTSTTSAFDLTVACSPIVCGDGVVVGDEECDDGGTATGDGCSDTCTVETGYFCTGEPSVCATLPANAECAGAVAIGGDETATTADIGLGGTRPSGTGCGGGSGAVLWYAVTVPASSITTLSATPSSGTSIDLTLHVLDSCSATSCDGFADSTSTTSESVELANGSTTDVVHYVAVGSYSSTGSGTADVTTTTVATVCGDGSIEGGEECDDGGTVSADGCSSTCTVETGYSCFGEPSTCLMTAANAECSGAVVLTDAAPASGDVVTGGARPTGTDCGSGSGPVLWYEITIPAGMDAVVTAVAGDSDLDSTIQVLDSCSATSCLDAEDSTFRGGTEVISIPNSGTTDETVYVAVGSWYSSLSGTGPVDVSVSFTTP